MSDRNLHDLIVKTGRSTEDVHTIGEIYSIIPLSIRKNLTIVPIDMTLPDSSKIMDRDKKYIEHVLCESKKSVDLSNLKMSREANITPTKDKEDNILSKLKKLPDITFNYIKFDPIFKIPETPKHIKNNSRKMTTSEVIKKKTNNTKKDINLKKPWNQKQKQINNYNPFISNNVNNAIVKKKEDAKSYRNHAYLEKENIQKTSSPNKKSKKIIVGLSNNFNVSHEIKMISKNDTVINNVTLEKNDSSDEKCMFMNSKILIEDQITSTAHSSPLGFIDVSDSEYDSFAMGIISSSEDSSINCNNMYTENYSEKGINSLIEQEETAHILNF